MTPDELKQDEEMVSINANDLDAEKLEEMEQELEDVSGGGCGNNSCWVYAEN